MTRVGPIASISSVRRLQPAALTLFGSVAASTCWAGGDIPVEARRVIAAVHHAAHQRDFGAIERLMAREFVWTFGPEADGSASQAIRAWRVDPVRLAELARVTGLQCSLQESGYVQCPANAGIGYRAGFRRTGQGWRMVYFLAGD